MEVVERSLVVGKGFQPKPIFRIIENPWTLIVVNGWGQTDIANKVIDLIMEKLSQKKVIDDDATTVRATDIPLTEPSELDIMKSAINAAHEMLLKDVNSEEWITAVEASILRIEGQSLQWVSVGKPHIFLKTESGIEPLNYAPDPNWHQRQSAPLALQAIGLDQIPFFQGGIMSYNQQNQLLLVGAGAVPTSFYLQDEFDLDKVARLFAEFLPKTPAWFGLIK